MMRTVEEVEAEIEKVMLARSAAIWKALIHNNRLKELEEEKKHAVYGNTDRKCECWKCEKLSCQVRDKYQRLPGDTYKGALGACPKLK